VRIAGHERHVVLLSRLHHGLGVPQRERHRLLDDDVLAGVGGDDRLLGVDSIGRLNPDGLDFRIRHELLDRLVHFGLGVDFLKPGANLRIGVRARVELEL